MVAGQLSDTPPAALIDSVAKAEGCQDATNEARLQCLFAKWLTEKVTARGIGALGYGEILPSGITSIVDKVTELGMEVGPEDVYADLGSGLGRTVLQLFLCTSVHRAVGVELMHQRHQAADTQRQRLLERINSPDVPAEVSAGRELAFVQGNFLETAPWQGATIVLTNSVLFPEDLMNGLREAFIDALEPGTVIFTSKHIPGCREDVLHRLGKMQADVSWKGEQGAVYMYMRLPRHGKLVLLQPSLQAEPFAKQQCELEAIEQSVTTRRCQARRLCTLEALRPFRHMIDSTCGWNELKYLSTMTALSEDARQKQMEAFLRDVPWQDLRDPEGTGYRGATVLHHAARQSKDGGEVVRRLLAARADATILDGEIRSPLYYAQAVEVVQLLVEARADPRQPDRWSQSPLAAAVKAKRVAIVSALLDARADVTEQAAGNRTLLHQVVKRSDHEEALEVAKMLLLARADPAQADIFGNRPADVAGHAELTKLLAVEVAIPAKGEETGYIPAFASLEL